MTTINAPPGEVLSALKRAVAGDTVRVLAGNHGPLTLYGYDKGGRVNLIGERGAVFGQTKFASCKNLLVRSLAFRGTTPKPLSNDPLVLVNGDSSGVSFDTCSFATEDDSSGWTPEDWRDKPFDVLMSIRGSQSNVTKSRFFNARACLSVSGSICNIDDNVMQAFSVDAVRFGGGGSGQTFRRNTIRDGRHHPLEPLHADAFQGYPAPRDGTSADITIAHNVIEASPRGDYMQGISAFDGHWMNVMVLCNRVSVCEAFHGITLFGVDGATIDGNTVLQERPGKKVPWIQVTKAKDGRPSSNVVVRVNIAPKLLLDRGSGVAVGNRRADGTPL